MKEEDFRKNVVDASDVAIDGIIIDYSVSPVQDKQDRWTKIKVGKVWKGRISDSEITIKDWQSYMYPLYSYGKGNRLLLLLKHEGDNYILTNSDWGSCVPSIIDIPPDGKVNPFITPQRTQVVDVFERSLFPDTK